MKPKNPFEFGRELNPAELVDRRDELAAVVQTMESAGRLFLIGPRRFGKTSILRVASDQAEKNGVVVLRHDAEAYPTLRLLAESVVAEAARRLATTAEKAGKKVKTFFGALRPELGFDPLTGSFSASLGAAKHALQTGLLVDVLDGLNAMAADAKRPVAVVIDEFQQVVEADGKAGGIDAERQIRAAVQRHEHVGYVFAGSKTTLLSEMTGESNRPFYRLGTRLFIGPIPREDFRPFIRDGFEDAGYTITDDAIEAILDKSEDVPYNVQRLAHECWNDVREANNNTMTPDQVGLVLERVVRRDDPFYTQTWRRMTSPQQKALLALQSPNDAGLYSRETLAAFGLALGTMQGALKALIRTGILREDETRGSVLYRLEDPFFGEWIRLFVGSPS